MPNTIIVDASNRVYAHQYGNKLTCGKFEVQAIFGFVKEIRALIVKNPGWSPLVLWDGRAQWRYDLFPEYKSGREKKALEDPDSAERKQAREAQIPYIRKALSWLGIHQMYATDQEADDMAGYFNKRITESGYLVRLISSDTDWSQLVGPSTQFRDPINDKLITPVNFFEMTGYKDGYSYIQGKALIGDTSDSIDGVPKIGQKTAPEILMEFGSIEEFFRQVDEGIFKPKYVKHKNLASPEGRAIFERNMKLMSLQDVKAPDPKNVRALKPELNKANFRALCEKLNFQSILREYDEWFAAFENRDKR